VSNSPLLTIVEAPVFVRAAARCMTETEKDQLIDFLARYPRRGVLIPGTGGVRKLRWAVGTRGKSGGVRVIYYYHSSEIPLFLLTAYAKSDKTNLTEAEKKQMKQVIRELVSGVRRS
jgi:hypothetical protein